MTDTTKAPEKIWAVFEPHYVKGQEPYVYASASPTRGKKYIRADLVNELIAAAYEDASEVAFGSFATGTGVRDEILAQTPDDARAALAARDQQVREEALREAAAMAKGCALLIAPESVSQRVGAKSVQSQVASQILALITEDQANE